MTTKTIKEFIIKFNEDLEWNIVGEKPTPKEWDLLEEYMKPTVKAVDNGIGYYEYGSICANDIQIEPEVQEEGETLKIKALISNSELLNMTPEEIIYEFLEYQDYIPSTYQWSTPRNEVTCDFELECIKAQYSPEHKAVIAEIGYVEA